MSEIDPHIDEVVNDLIEWMIDKGVWEWYSDVFVETNEYGRVDKTSVRDSLDLVREIEVAVLEDNEMSYGDYMDRRYKMVYPEGSSNFESPGETYAVDQQGPKPRLRALHRTLREGGEIEWGKSLTKKLYLLEMRFL